LPFLPSPDPGRPRPMLGLADRLLRRSRLRALLRARARGAALAYADGRGSVPLRPRCDRALPDRVRANRNGCRLLSAENEPIRYVTRPVRPPSEEAVF